MSTKTKEPPTKPRRPITQVEVAKDILKLLDAGRIKAETGNYIEGITGDLQLALKERGRKKAPCEVCAIGAALCAFAYKHDSVIIDWHIANPRDQAVEMLSEAFSPRDLDLIEAAFEGWTLEGDAERYAAGTWGQKVGPLYTPTRRAYRPSFAEERLRAICKVILKNGKFSVPGYKAPAGKEEEECQ